VNRDGPDGDQARSKVRHPPIESFNQSLRKSTVSRFSTIFDADIKAANCFRFSKARSPRCFNLCYISSGVRGESGDWSTAVLVRTASTSIAMESMHSASRNHMDSKYLIEVFTDNNPALFSNGPFLSNTRS